MACLSAHCRRPRVDARILYRGNFGRYAWWHREIMSVSQTASPTTLHCRTSYRFARSGAIRTACLFHPALVLALAGTPGMLLALVDTTSSRRFEHDGTRLQDVGIVPVRARREQASGMELLPSRQQSHLDRYGNTARRNHHSTAQLAPAQATQSPSRPLTRFRGVESDTKEVDNHAKSLFAARREGK